MRVRHARWLRSATALVLGCCASCGGDTGPGGNTGTAATGQSSASLAVPPESCTRPGDEGNSKGVGKFCTPLGSECAPFMSTAPSCLAKLGQTEWMCTRIGCTDGSQCGEGAGCLKEAMGSACVPCRCDTRGEGCAGGSSSSATSASSSGSGL